jgi:hypothetical protein
MTAIDIARIGGLEIATKIVVTHQIAGIMFRTETNAWLPALKEDPFECFRVGESVTPDIVHRIYKVEPHSLTWPSPTSGEWMQFPPNTRLVLSELESPLLRSPLVCARLRTILQYPKLVRVSLLRDWILVRDFAKCELDLFYLPEFHEHGAEKRVASDFRLLFSSFLPCFSAVQIHSASAVRNGKAAVFLAPDEGGKTTLMGLSAGLPILHDDQVIFRQEGDVVHAHATPLGLKTSGPYSAPIGGFFWLEKAPHFELLPLKAVDLVQPLWGAHKRYTGSLPKYLKKRAFEVVCDACYQAPAYRMRFPKDHVDWDAIDAAMAG